MRSACPGAAARCEQNEVAGPQCLELGQAEVSRPARPGSLDQAPPGAGFTLYNRCQHQESTIPGPGDGGEHAVELTQFGRAYLLRPETQPPRRPHDIAHGIFRGALAKPVPQPCRVRRHLVKLRDQRKTMQTAINRHPCQPVPPQPGRAGRRCHPLAPAAIK